jgi:catechol 2,3-dioxygenase-like lactoylglutathione lyase family enzyme
VWYRVRDLEAGRDFYTQTLGFNETYFDVEDVKAEAQRLREAGVEVGVVLELHDELRILDVFDPDGNRIQLAQLLAP